jgi:hypothetical protein
MKPTQAITRTLTWTLAFMVATNATAQQPDAKPAVVPPAVAPPDQVQPKTPLGPRAPVRAEWTVRMTAEFPGGWESEGAWEQASDSPSENRVIRSIDFSKDAAIKTYRLKTRWSDGESEEEWIVMGQHVAERPGGRGLYIVGAESSTAQDYGKSDFPELDWLEMSHYRGMKTYKGKQAFRFSLPFDQKRLSRSEAQLLMLAKQADPSITPSKFFKPKSPQVVVYLDAATQLPLLFNDGSTIRRYDYSPPPSTSLRPSPTVLKFLRDRQKALTTRLATPPGP